MRVAVDGAIGAAQSVSGEMDHAAAHRNGISDACGATPVTWIAPGGADVAQDHAAGAGP